MGRGGCVQREEVEIWESNADKISEYMEVCRKTQYYYPVILIILRNLLFSVITVSQMTLSGKGEAGCGGTAAKNMSHYSFSSPPIQMPPNNKIY